VGAPVRVQRIEGLKLHVVPAPEGLQKSS